MYKVIIAVMPRPALELYKQIPITYKHRSLLLSTESSDQAQVDSILPQIASGFTGLICSYQQCQTQIIQSSYLPKIITLAEITSMPAKDLIGMATKLGAVAVKFEITLGDSQSNQQLQRLPSVITQAQKAKLITMLEASSAQDIPKHVSAIMQAYVLRICADYRVGFSLTTHELNAKELQQSLHVANLDNLIAKSSIRSSTEIRRMLATGISGLVVNLSDLEKHGDPSQTAFQLGEAVFGPGSYLPKHG